MAYSQDAGTETFPFRPPHSHGRMKLSLVEVGSS